MRRLRRGTRRERGVSAVIFAFVAVAMLAATGLGVDTGNLALQSSRVQHSADAAAFAIAYDCIAKRAECSPGGGAGTATHYATENASGDSGSATSPGGLSSSSTEVTATVTKSVSTYFMTVVGVDSRTSTKSATVTWGKHATAAKVPPFAVSLCTYVAGKSSGANTFIAADINDKISTIKKNDVLSTTPILTSIPPILTSCTKPSGVAGGIPSSVTTATGGLWILSVGASCGNPKVPLSLGQTDDANGNSGPAGCSGKLGEAIGSAGNVILLPVYAPRNNFNYNGAIAAPLDSPAGKMQDNKGSFAIQIVGFTPFKVTGWRLGSSTGGTIPGTQGLTGTFVDSGHEFEDATYTTGGANFGAVKVELTN